MRSGVIQAPTFGNGKKEYKAGDTVTELNFPPGNFDKLVKRGFIIEKVEAEEQPADKKKRK